MKDYRQLIKELPSKTIVLACGKFNPPTIGHELLIKAVKSLAEQKNASYAIYASDLSDAKKNPLIVEKKLQYLNLLFPNTQFTTYSDNINEMVTKLKETYRNVIIVTSADKVASMKKSLREATVISALDKDPDSEDITRSYAVKGLYEEFKKNLPSAIREIDSRRLMNDLRVGSGLDPIKEEIKLVKDELREQYFRGEIFNIGEQVEADGKQYEIVKRGSNHLLLKESTGKLISKWIQNVKLIDESHKVGDKVIIHKGPADVVGKTGHVGEIRKRYVGDSKTYTIDHEGGSIQLKSTHFKALKEQKKKLKSFKSTVRNNMAACPVCNMQHAGECPQDFRNPYDPMSSSNAVV